MDIGWVVANANVHANAKVVLLIEMRITLHVKGDFIGGRNLRKREQEIFMITCRIPTRIHTPWFE